MECVTVCVSESVFDIAKCNCNLMSNCVRVCAFVCCVNYVVRERWKGAATVSPTSRAGRLCCVVNELRPICCIGVQLKQEPVVVVVIARSGAKTKRTQRQDGKIDCAHFCFGSCSYWQICVWVWVCLNVFACTCNCGLMCVCKIATKATCELQQ